MDVPAADVATGASTEHGDLHVHLRESLRSIHDRNTSNR
jgi:hypothetical protein